MLAAAGELQRLHRCALQEIERGGDIDAIALSPAVLMVVPFDRNTGISSLNARVQKHRQQSLEVRRAPKQELDARHHVVLVERVGRDRSGHREQTRDYVHKGRLSSVAGVLGSIS